MALTDRTQAQRLDLAWLKPIYMVHIELTAKTLYLSDQNYKYTYGATTVNYESYLSDLETIAAQVGSVGREKNTSFNLKVFNEAFGSDDYLIELHDSNSFLSRKVSIYEIRTITKDETFASDVKTLLWTGYTEKVKAITKESFIIVCSSRLYHLRDKLSIKKVNLSDFPSADPDDVGKPRNIIYGDIEHVPCLAIKAGVVDTLAADITSSATTIYISGASISEFPTGACTIQIDDEKISITSRSGNTFTVASRGYDSTTATEHDKGASIAEVLTEYIYEGACHPGKSIGSVFVDDVRQLSGYTAYTGQSGDELTGYEDTAVIEFSVLPVVKHQVNLDVSTGSHNHVASSSGSSSKLTYMSGTGANDFSNPANAYDGSDVTYAQGDTEFDGFSESMSLSHGLDTDLGTITEQYVHVIVDCQYDDVDVDLYFNDDLFTNAIGGSTAKVTKRINVTASKAWDPGDVKVLLKKSNPHASMWVRIYEIWIETIYTADISINNSAATGVALSGNSSANTVIGNKVTINMTGYQDDGSGTYTGTPDALIEQPDHVMKHMLIELLGMTAGDIGSSFAASGTLYAAAISGGYKLAFLANEISEKADKVLYTLAHDCRSMLYDFQGDFELVYLPDTVSSADENITADEVMNDPVYELSDVSEIKNKFNGYYRRDYRKPGGSPGDAYMDMVDVDSGAGDMPIDIELKSVRLSAMATDVIEWMIDQQEAAMKSISLITTWHRTGMSPSTTFDFSAGIYGSTIFRLEQFSIDPKTRNVTLKGRETT